MEEQLNLLKDKGLLSEDQVTNVTEESKKVPYGSDEVASYEF